MARIASLIAVVSAVLLAACTAGHTRPAATAAGASTPANGRSGQAGLPASPAPVRGATYVSGGCGATPLLKGAAPDWASSADHPSIRYALGKHGQAAAFVFGYPLMAGNPEPYSDKILWIVASPRDGMPLRLTGHPLGAAAPVVSSAWPADSAPGEIYPSDMVVPSSGCWQFTLTWNGHSDTIDLWYVTHR
jgi:hypothetical protein